VFTNATASRAVGNQRVVVAIRTVGFTALKTSSHARSQPNSQHVRQVGQFRKLSDSLRRNLLTKPAQHAGFEVLSIMLKIRVLREMVSPGSLEANHALKTLAHCGEFISRLTGDATVYLSGAKSRERPLFIGTNSLSSNLGILRAG
jgi:hypothetical protein